MSAGGREAASLIGAPPAESWTARRPRGPSAPREVREPAPAKATRTGSGCGVGRRDPKGRLGPRRHGQRRPRARWISSRATAWPTAWRSGSRVA